MVGSRPRTFGTPGCVILPTHGRSPVLACVSSRLPLHLRGLGAPAFPPTRRSNNHKRHHAAAAGKFPDVQSSSSAKRMSCSPSKARPQAPITKPVLQQQSSPDLGSEGAQKRGNTTSTSAARFAGSSADSEESASKAETAASSVSSEPPVHRRRGRPCGIPAWNKDKKLSAAHRKNMSKTMKQKWKDPEYKAKRLKTFNKKGMPAWNKEMAMSLETRENMGRAKRGKTLKKSTKAKMRATHSMRDNRHTPETRALISAKLRGRSRSPAHRAAISAGLRRRQAAARVLAAVEDVHRELTLAKHSGPGSSSYESAARRSGGGKTPTRNQLMNSYKSQLREYRNLQEELQPWTTAFTTKEGRKPTLKDVEATRIEWLVVRYKQYVLLRDQLLRAIPAFRAKTGDDGSSAAGVSGAERHGSSTVIAEEAAARVQAAMEYRQRQQGAASVPGAAESDDSGDNGSAREIPTAGPGANARVSEALQAALDYRQNKAMLASAKAKAAAAMAGGAKSPQKPPTAPQ